MARPLRIVVVGGHSGLGLATLQHLFRSTGFRSASESTPGRAGTETEAPPVHLILLVRNPNADHALTALTNLAAVAVNYDQSRNGAENASRVELRSMDLADIKSIRTAAARLLQDQIRIDTLWLNAAVAKSNRELVHDNSDTAVTEDTYEHTALVNHAGPLLLLDLLMPLLLDRNSPTDRTKSRIVFTGSALHRNLSRERDPDEVLCADFQSSALPNRHENEPTEGNEVGSSSTVWSLRTSYAHSKFLQALGVRKFIRLLEQALEARASQSGSSSIEARPWNPMEVVLVQPGFIPTTGLNREATLPARILTSYLLPNMPGTSSFVSTLQEGAEVLAAALSWPLQQARSDGGHVQHGFEVESVKEDLAPAEGWVGQSTQAADQTLITKALVVKGKVLQRPDDRTDNIELQDRWWPSRLCRSEWVHAPEETPFSGNDGADEPGKRSGDGSKDESDEGGGRETDVPDSSGVNSASTGQGAPARTSTPRADGSSQAPSDNLALSTSSLASSSTDGTSVGPPTPRSGGRSRRLTVSEAATALHGLALSGSFLGEMSDMTPHFMHPDHTAEVAAQGLQHSKTNPETTSHSPQPELAIDTSKSGIRSDAEVMAIPSTPINHSDSFQSGPSAASLPTRTPPRRQASSPLSLYSTSADMLSVRRASASALQPQPQRVHASAVIHPISGGMTPAEEAIETFIDDSEYVDSYAVSPSHGRNGTGGTTSSGRYLSLSPSASPRRPSGPASAMWSAGYSSSPMSSSPVPMPSPYGWRSSSLGTGTGNTSGPIAFSPSTASYTRSFFSRPTSFSQSHTRSASFSLIGSYDESLLSGRMSTMPSQPFDFDAELGVLGMGKGERECPRKLRCPKHLSVGFEARYYALGADGETGSTAPLSPSPSPSFSSSSLSPSPKPKAVPRLEKSTAGSPYVGSIDLEAFFFKRLEEVVNTVRQANPSIGSKLSTGIESQAESKLSPADALAQVPVFPGYQVPPKGQIQLIVKNQNLTAVKVFLIKYDLSDMQPGTKTFIRQKSYVSADVSADRSLSGAGGGANARLRQHSGEKEKETMRYAVHLQFACPPLVSKESAKSTESQVQGRGTEYTIASARDAPVPVPIAAPSLEPVKTKGPPKIYLHRNIRVVFAATGLDSFERLDVITETPVGHVASSSIEPERRSGAMIYSAYAGPTEGWRRMRRAVRKRLVAMKQAEEEREEAERARVAAEEAERLARVEEEERKRIASEAAAEAAAYGEEEGTALESSVHSAFGIPAPRWAKSRPGSKRSSRIGFGGSEESDYLYSSGHSQSAAQHLASPDLAGSSYGATFPTVNEDVPTTAGTRPSSPAAAPRPYVVSSLRRRGTLSRSGTVPTLDENRVVSVVPPAVIAGSTMPMTTGGLLASLPMASSPSGGSLHHRQRRPGTSSSSSSSSFSGPTAAAAVVTAGAERDVSADQELLDSWHRSLRRNSSASSHGGHGMSNASMMGTPGSRPGSPAHMLWNYSASLQPTGSGSRVGMGSSRPTSPDPTGFLPSVQERVGGVGGDEEAGSTAASLLAQLQAHHQASQLQSITAAFSPTVSSSMPTNAGTATMPRLIRRVSGAGRPFSPLPPMSSSVSSSSSGGPGSVAASGGMWMSGEEGTQGYAAGGVGNADDDGLGGSMAGQRRLDGRIRQGSSAGMTR
ncbi:hypothetical protein CF327_g872 [Tilletia walkeri]|uniref:Atos-like conserved domain-containing protein n=1 Tax=Tilletia walkeri TaxID=117179 RepID=A0A8X7NDN3_9BASI|nr:hypothetical protein CF327_g872 [Tilletia walkeri]KAE8272071.1 hypothetical protein A4X09_0g278 [Tilletia walkeri]